MARYLRPDSLAEALAALQEGAAVLAGGTDFYPSRGGVPVDADVLDVTRIKSLRGIDRDGAAGCTRIGAATTWTDVVEAGLPRQFRGLQLAAREVGGVQIQNAGTVAGNLCNASPAADGVPALLALSASVELASATGTRVLPLDAFILGPRRTALAPGELVIAIVVPDASSRARSTFLKLGARRYLVISIAMVSVLVDTDAAGRIVSCGIAVGACSAVARRLPALEQALAGQPLAPGLGARVEQAHLAPLAPIDDVRASAGYRLDAAGTLVRRALEELAHE
jgi:CO/xanthine dehydrogenase FAD-binding subunit